jgi:hypothetical protein
MRVIGNVELINNSIAIGVYKPQDATTNPRQVSHLIEMNEVLMSFQFASCCGEQASLCTPGRCSYSVCQAKEWRLGDTGQACC